MERSRRRRRRRKSNDNTSENEEVVKNNSKSSNKSNNEKSSKEKRNTNNQSSKSNRRSRSGSNRENRKEKDPIKKPMNDIKYEDPKINVLNLLRQQLVEAGPIKYTEDDYIRYRFSVSEKYHDFTSLVYMTNDIEEARTAIILFPNLKVFTNEGILAYPQPPISCKNGYFVRDEKTNKEISKHSSLSSAITSCEINMIITDQNENRVY